MMPRRNILPAGFEDADQDSEKSSIQLIPDLDEERSYNNCYDSDWSETGSLQAQEFDLNII